jgi:hypothetical protein
LCFKAGCASSLAGEIGIVAAAWMDVGSNGRWMCEMVGWWDGDEVVGRGGDDSVRVCWKIGWSARCMHRGGRPEESNTKQDGGSDKRDGSGDGRSL